MTLCGLRGWLYWLARLLGDVNAAQKGKIAERVERRIVGKIAGRLLRSLFRVVLAAWLLGGSAFAGQERGPDALALLLVPGGGTVRQEGGRVDLYDVKSNRIGYGYIRGDGSVDIFNADGTRRATITPGPGGQPGRIILPKGKGR
ncbi:MAG: hypothetical protein HY724_00805 [Candidatus Rokubacteria bacterium]|nr:hypothetical protein [Candidatus Rokubacteria bacterium]